MKKPLKSDSLLKSILIVILLLFGGVTLFMSSSILFDWFGIRAREGNFVPFVVQANWLCGILYVLCAVLLIRNNGNAKIPLIIALIILIGAYAGLFIHLNNGGLFEQKTVIAMAFRIVFTSILLLLIHKKFKK